MNLYNTFKNDELLSKWLINNFNQLSKLKINNVTGIIDHLKHKNYSNERIIELAKAPNYMNGVQYNYL